MNEKQHALAAEIRAEMAAQRISAADMQRRTAIKHASWRNWFVTAKRAVPYPELEAVAEVLNVPLSVLLERAAERARRAQVNPPSSQDLADEAIARMSPAARRKIQEVRPDDPPEQGTAHDAV